MPSPDLPDRGALSRLSSQTVLDALRVVQAGRMYDLDDVEKEDEAGDEVPDFMKPDETDGSDTPGTPDAPDAPDTTDGTDEES